MDSRQNQHQRWIQQAREIFKAPKPDHFTRYEHCEECAEHDSTLLSASLDSLSMQELGNPGWDPLCFCVDEGKRYLIPALVRLSLQTMERDFYLEQFLFHLQGQGADDSFMQSCSLQQRSYLCNFLLYLIEEYPQLLEHQSSVDDVFRVLEQWQESLPRNDTEI